MDNRDIVACLANNEPRKGYLRKVADELYLENSDGRIPFKHCQVVAPVSEIIRRMK